MDGTRVGDLARSVHRDEPARLAVTARVEGKDGERVGPPLSDEVDVLPRAAEAVKQHDRGEALQRRIAVRLVERGAEVDAVVHVQHEVVSRESGRAPGGDERDHARDENRDDPAAQGFHHRIAPWIRGRSGSSTRAWAG